MIIAVKLPLTSSVFIMFKVNIGETNRLHVERLEMKLIRSYKFFWFLRTAFSQYIVEPAACINPIESQIQTSLASLVT